MAETDNTARMASKVSDEIFEVFGWKRVGPVNQNWACVHQPHSKKTHPSDVVFWYDDPYTNKRVFCNVDLKSYAATTLTKQNLGAAIASLAKSVECANVSSEWQQLYLDDHVGFRCDGLLFVYNHDGEFDKNFPVFLNGVDSSNFRLPPGRRIAVLGPPDVAYLVNVAHDIAGLRGRQKLPADPSGSEFWYPDLVRPKRRIQAESAASIEMLTGPWITLRPKPEYQGKLQFFVWYRGRGETVDEFKYLLDSFFRFQLLAMDSHAAITVRLVDADRTALPNFHQAKQLLSGSLYGLARDRLERVTCENISNFVRRFDPTEIGMEAR